MTSIISGPGVGLPLPAALYPPNLNGTPLDVNSNYIGLPPGGSIVFPATNSMGILFDTGANSVLEWLDPVTGVWRLDQRSTGGVQHITSDGFTRRISNLTGCPVAAIVAGGGTNFAAATATITANIGGSTWQAIVGGSLSVSTITAAGANYTLPPILHIALPPSPGIPATGYCTLTSGSVSSVSLTNFGAGYLTATVGAAILPSPFDPNAGTITTASVTIILNAGNSGAITGALCTYNGSAIVSASIASLTLTAAGGNGSGATITPLVMQTIVSASAVAGGAGWGDVAAPPGVITAGGGGAVSVSAIVNPAVEMTNFKPRMGLIGVTSTSLGVISAPVVVDPGLFLSAPTALVVPGGSLPTTLASIALTMGSLNDVVMIQPL
jgi:hypothetical protein